MLHFAPRVYTFIRVKEDEMDISTLGPTTLDPFAPIVGRPAEETREPIPAETPAPLPEGAGTVVDTSA